MKFADWFNVYNMDHIQAFGVLMKTGAWPRGFISYEDDGIDFSNWYIEITGKMAAAWVEQVLADHVIGMPPAPSKPESENEN